MQNIEVHRYSNPETQKFWQGYIEPDDRGWIMFVAAAGDPVVYLNRDPETGAVLSPGAVALVIDETEPDRQYAVPGELSGEVVEPPLSG